MSSFSGFYRIINAESGTALSITDPHQPIVCISTGRRDKRSLWRLTLQPNGGYRLTNSMHALQARIGDYDDSNLLGSKFGGHVWSIRKGTGNEYILHSGVGDYVAELSNEENDGDKIVQVSRDKAAKYQRWILTEGREPDNGNPISKPGVYVIISAKTDTVIGLKRGSSGGNEVYAYEEDNSDGQKWVIQRSGNSGYMTIRNVATNKYAAFPKFEEYAVLQLSSTPHEYTIKTTTNGFCITPKEESGYVMDLRGGSEANGTEIILWPNHGKENQKWYFKETN